MRPFEVGDAVFYDPRSTASREDFMSTAPYEKIGCEVTAVTETGVTLKRLGGDEIIADVPFDQVERQTG